MAPLVWPEQPGAESAPRFDRDEMIVDLQEETPHHHPQQLGVFSGHRQVSGIHDLPGPQCKNKRPSRGR